jgi:hypothetical protein
MVTGGDDRWWKWWWFCFREQLFTKFTNANPNPGKTGHSIASQKCSYWRFKAQNILEFRLTVLCPCGQVDKRYGQIVWSPFPYPITSHEREGSHRKRGEGSSQVWYLTIPYPCQFVRIIISDWMQWIAHQRAYPTIHVQYSSSAGLLPRPVSEKDRPNQSHGHTEPAYQ